MKPGLFLISILALPALGRAQMNGGPGAMVFDVGSFALSRNMLDVNLRNAATLGRRGGKAPSLAYAPSQAVTERVKRGYVAAFERQHGAARAASMRKWLATDDFVALWTKNVASDGMRPGNLTDAMTEYWALNWAVANGKRGTSREQVQALRRALAPAVAANPEVRRLGAAGRQALAESLMLNYVVQAMGANAAAAKGDPALVARVRSATIRRFKAETGVDLTAIRLTANGVEGA